jgi:hypothetical protein
LLRLRWIFSGRSATVTGHAFGAGDAVAHVVLAVGAAMMTWSGSSTASVPSIRLTLPMKSATKRVAGVS